MTIWAIQDLHGQIQESEQQLLDIDLTTVTAKDLGIALVSIKEEIARARSVIRAIYLQSASFGVKDSAMKPVERHYAGFRKLVARYECYQAELAKIESATQEFVKYKETFVENADAQLVAAGTSRLHQIQNYVTRRLPASDLRGFDAAISLLEEKFLATLPSHTKESYEKNESCLVGLEQCKQAVVASYNRFRQESASLWGFLDARKAVIKERIDQVNTLCKVRQVYMQKCELFLEKQQKLIDVQVAYHTALAASLQEAIVVSDGKGEEYYRSRNGEDFRL